MDNHHLLQVETPEQVALEFPLASIGSRCLALALDGAILCAILFAGLILLMLILPHARASQSWILAICALAVFLVEWGYFAAFEIFWRGQTPGKRVLAIRVIQDSGRAPTAFASLTRNLIRVIDALPGCFGVGLVCMMANRQSKRLGDLAAGTVVVHDRRLELAPAAAPGPALPAIAGAAALPPADLELIETFLLRRMDLDPELRAATARRIAAHLESQLHLPAPASPDRDERFLESVAEQIRDAANFRRN